MIKRAGLWNPRPCDPAPREDGHGFWEALFARLLQTSTIGHLPSKLGSATSHRVRHQLLRALPPSLIDDFVPPPAATSPSVDKRYTHRDPICYCCMPAVLIMLMFIMSMFMLSNLTTMMPVYEIVMIYVLVLILKLPTFSTRYGLV